MAICIIVPPLPAGHWGLRSPPSASPFPYTCIYRPVTNEKLEVMFQYWDKKELPQHQNETIEHQGYTWRLHRFKRATDFEWTYNAIHEEREA